MVARDEYVANFAKIATLGEIAAQSLRGPRWPDALGRITLGEEGADGFHRSWVEMLPEGTFDHPQWGKLNFSRKVLDDLKRSFDDHARGIDIALDYDHKASEGNSAAPGWIECVEYRPATDSAPAGLWARVRWTRLGLSDVRDQIYRYLSAEIKENYTNEITGKTYKIALLGLTLTNRPFMKQLPAIALAESNVSTRAWGSVDKTCLPNSAFMDPKNRRLPIYEGAGPKVNGKYTKRGKLNIHGLEAALAAVHGAHTGKAMTGLPAGTVDKIERLAAAHGLGGGGSDAAGSKAASEDGGNAMALEDSEHSATVMRFMGGSTTEGSFVKKPMGAHDESDDMRTESAELADGMDDGETYDDGEDGADGDGEDGSFDKSKNTHGAMTTDGHTHGKYAEHSHDGDADHSDVPMASKRSMSERDERGMTFAEMQQRLQLVERQNREQARQLAEYAMGRQLSEVTKRMPGRAMSKVAREAISGLMLSEDMLGVPQALRERVWRTIELALTRGTVDTRTLGSAHDAEARRTVKAGEAGVSMGPREQPLTLGEGRVPVTGAEVVDLAEKIALDEGVIKAGQTLLDVPNEQRALLLARAGKEQG